MSSFASSQDSRAKPQPPLTQLNPQLVEAAWSKTPDGLVYVDRQGKILFINAAAQGILGKVFAGGDIDDFAKSYDFRRLDGSRDGYRDTPLARALLKRERIETQLLASHTNGEQLTVSAVALPLDDEQRRSVGALLILRDITAASHLERELRLSEERFKSLVHATAKMVWSTTPDGSVVEDSPSWRAFTGQSYEEFRGRGWLDVVHPAEQPEIAEIWREAVRTRGPYEVEYRIRGPDGSYRWTLARGTPVLDDRGEVREWIGCNWDITSIKAAQEDQARVAEFQQTALGMLGHDLRNPLSAILLAAVSLQREELGATEVHGISDRITRSAQRALSILDRLLDFTEAKLGGGLKLKRIECDLSDICAEIASEFKGQTAGREVHLHRHGETRGFWDRTRLGQVVSNLIGNAIHHGTPGTEVQVSLRGRPHEVELRVENQAPPIPPDELRTLFDPFMRGEGQGAQRNLGLGLYIVKQAIDAHGGSVTVSSDSTKTAFTVVLPRRL